MRSFDIRTMHRHSVSLIIGNHRVVIDIQREWQVQARDGVPLCLHNIDTAATSESEAVRLSTSTRKSLRVDIIAISDTAPANLCRISKIISDTSSSRSDEWPSNTVDIWRIRFLTTWRTSRISTWPVDGGYMLIDNMTDSTDICDIVYRYSRPVTGSMKKYCDDGL
jgi:hypothetical protein